MRLDERITQAMQHVANGVTPPPVDTEAVRSRARGHRVRTVVVCATIVLVTVLVAVTTWTGGRDTNATLPAATPTASRIVVIDPNGWPVYVSGQYGFTIAHPPDWTEAPATRAWDWQSDGVDGGVAGQETFYSPTGALRVSAWSVPLPPGERVESTAYHLGFVEDYCERTANGPCSGIADRAVDLCLEMRDCHPGLLVPFENDVQAFFSGGDHAKDTMVVVAVWRGESAPAVEQFGGARKLLESFLATMNVWPRPTPVEQRN